MHFKNWRESGWICQIKFIQQTKNKLVLASLNNFQSWNLKQLWEFNVEYALNIFLILNKYTHCWWTSQWKAALLTFIWQCEVSHCYTCNKSSILVKRSKNRIHSILLKFGNKIRKFRSEWFQLTRFVFKNMSVEISPTTNFNTNR